MCLGVPGKVIAVKENGLALVDVDGNQMDVSIRLTPEVEPNQYVLIHAGLPWRSWTKRSPMKQCD